MGFVSIPTEGKHTVFGDKSGELDSVFIYENIVLIVEDTTSTKVFNHAKNKKLLAEQISDAKSDFIVWLREEFPEHGAILKAYRPERFKVFFLYVSMHEMDLNDAQLRLLQPMRVVTVKALNYFDKLARTIRRSARTDLWRFLELGSRDIGAASATRGSRTIETAIISPADNTGFSNEVRLVSFMISAETLLKNGYVLRKDNWGYSIDLYQRLIDASRLKKIRRYVAAEGSAFLNNIILGLPPNVSFQTTGDNPVRVELDDIQDYANYRMTIPDEFNSLCIIDGQHRVFAHYEGVDDLEKRIAEIRGKVHLLATGLVFPSGMDVLESLRLQGEIFLDINSNSKPVPADVLLAIQSLRAPYADVAVARRVLEELNRRDTFRGMLQLSQMDDAPIKVASIVKFALRYLVDIDSDEGLFVEWVSTDATREQLREKSDSKLLAEYVQFSASILDRYFGAFRSCHASVWFDRDSRITSTTVINAMIIALRRALPLLGLLSFEEYRLLFANWDVDFSKSEFAYSSSQYNRFSRQVLSGAFGLVENGGVWSLP